MTAAQVQDPDALRAWELRADPLADDTIERILGPHDGAAGAAMWAAIGTVNRQLAQWQTNGQLAAWRPDADVPEPIAAALRDYLRAGLALPDWADPEKILRAETLFFEMSMMSCTLLFCASLPECYVLPDLSGVLHVAGQLEARTDYRIRATAAMLFPVMMRNGLTGSDGGGVAQTLKVRLIHATIRHLILRGSPASAVRQAAAIAPLPPQADGAPTLHQSLYAHGWDIAADGLPCNQQELAYTLLTFHYIYLRGLRKLGLGLPAADEAAYLHAWNVMGHVLGIDKDLMVESMADAEQLFARMQARGRGQSWLPDPRPALGAALMHAMENEIPIRLLKPFPVLLTRYLCGSQTAADLGLTGRVSLLSRAVFVLGMGATRAFDWVVRRFVPGFSICRMLTRVVGYRFTVKVLMDQTRPLKLPTALLNDLHATVGSWQHDPKAPQWVNKLEARLSGRPADSQAQGRQPC
jgi:hypothetical protein